MMSFTLYIYRCPCINSLWVCIILIQRLRQRNSHFSVNKGCMSSFVLFTLIIEATALIDSY